MSLAAGRAIGESALSQLKPRPNHVGEGAGREKMEHVGHDAETPAIAIAIAIAITAKQEAVQTQEAGQYLHKGAKQICSSRLPCWTVSASLFHLESFQEQASQSR